MKLLKKTLDAKKIYPFGFFCEWLSIKLYAVMRKCELNSQRGEAIENIAKRRQDDVESARAVKEEVFYSRELISDKEKQLERCLNYVQYIGFNFRKGNYKEIDTVLKELGI